LAVMVAISWGFSRVLMGAGLAYGVALIAIYAVAVDGGSHGRAAPGDAESGWRTGSGGAAP